MDSRIEPLPMLGLEPGDAKILRNAGARVTDDVLRTLADGQLNHRLGGRGVYFRDPAGHVLELLTRY